MVNDKVTVSNIIEIRNLSFGYKYHDPIIDGVSLDIPRGRFIGLLGPSGAGKTTLLKLILGLNKPWNGNIKFGKKNDRDKTKEFPSIGYSPQAESVDWDFPITVTELVSMGLWNASGVFPWINNNIKKRIRILLDELEIGKYHNRQIRELSGGEQKRVFLARALINNPDLLILDEPTSGLDPLSREKIIQKLIEINNSGITIMISTHDIDGVAKKIPWVICLNRQIVSQGNPNVILSENTIYKTYGLKE